VQVCLGREGLASENRQVHPVHLSAVLNLLIRKRECVWTAASGMAGLRLSSGKSLDH
jgi:hypothetical protein